MGLSATSPHRAQLQLDGGSKASVSVFVGDRGLCIWTDDAFHQTIGIRKSQLARKFDFAKHVRRRMDPRVRTWAKEMAGSPECSTAMTMPLWPPGSEESSARHESPAAPREEPLAPPSSQTQSPLKKVREASQRLHEREIRGANGESLMLPLPPWQTSKRADGRRHR